MLISNKYLCGIETCDPSGVRILWKSTLKGSHVYKIWAARGQKELMNIYPARDQIARDMWPLRGQDIVKIDPEGVACL